MRPRQPRPPRIVIALLLAGFWPGGSAWAEDPAECPRRWTFPVPFFQSVSWSPDGEWIAFDSDRDATEGDELYLVRPDGSDLEQLVEQGVFPTWAPDSRSLLFAAGGLETVAIDGSGRSRLLEQAVYGAWSPDGSSIAAAATEFDSECNDHHSLVLLDSRGTRLATLWPQP